MRCWISLMSAGIGGVTMGCGTNLHTGPWIEPHRTVTVTTGHSEGQQRHNQNNPPHDVHSQNGHLNDGETIPGDIVFPDRYKRYEYKDLSFGMRQPLGERIELGTSLSPLAIDLKFLLVDAPVALSLLPRWNILNLLEGANAEVPILLGWRNGKVAIFGALGPRWLMSSRFILLGARRQSEVGFRLSLGASLKMQEVNYMVELGHNLMLYGVSEISQTGFSLGVSL